MKNLVIKSQKSGLLTSEKLRVAPANFGEKVPDPPPWTLGQGQIRMGGNLQQKRGIAVAIIKSVTTTMTCNAILQLLLLLSAVSSFAPVVAAAVAVTTLLLCTVHHQVENGSAQIDKRQKTLRRDKMLYKIIDFRKAQIAMLLSTLEVLEPQSSRECS